jgi:hypothetical protein
VNVAVPVELLAELFGAFASQPWPCDDDVTERLVRGRLAAGELESRDSHSWTDAEYRSAAVHAGRIAHLMRSWQSSDAEALQLEIISPDGMARLHDGHHRLWAAALRGDESVHVEISGYLSAAERLLGLARA